jgi:hypothetical protein
VKTLLDLSNDFIVDVVVADVKIVNGPIFIKQLRQVPIVTERVVANFKLSERLMVF